MKRRGFLIPSLLAAGLTPADAAHAALTNVTSTGNDDPNAGTLLRLFQQDHAVTLAQHRSHSSHSSHSSHRSSSGGHYSHTSHRSSTGGYSAPVDTPAPVYSPPAPSPPASSPPLPEEFRSPPAPPGAIRATPPSSDTPATLSGRSARFAAIVRRVQIGLLGQGVYDGPINGNVGPLTRAALRKFQKSHGLDVTGTITPETLDALRISSE